MSKSPLPPGPRSLASLISSARDPFPWMVRLGLEHADPATCPIPGRAPIVLTWSPEGAKTVFTADPDTFAPGTPEALAVIVGRGSVFLKSGEDHRRARRLLAPPFHGERMRAYAALMHETALRHARARPPGVSAPILPVAQAITLDIIVEAIFGARDPDEVARLHAEILAVVDAFDPLSASFRFLQRDFGGLSPWARFRRRTEALHAHLRALLAAKRERPGDDVLSLLVAARDEDGNGLPEQEILEQLLTFVIAGHETTATTLAWAMDQLHRAPEALARLRAELATLGGSPAPEAIAKLPFLDAVCCETLRLHPPVPLVPRLLKRALTLGGYTLPPGTNVAVGVYNAHLRAETFEEPLAFRPARFVGRTHSPFEFMPFGGGARRCLGAAFAMFELKIALAALLAAGTWRLDEPRPLRTVFRIGTYGPEHGVRMTRVAD